MNPNINNQVNMNPQYSTYTPPIVEVPVETESKDKSKLLLVIIIVILLVMVALLFFNQKESYAVVFVNGEEIEAFVVKENENVSEKIMAGTNFLGWYNNNIKYDFSTKVTSNIILHAKWQDDEKMYNVTFDTDGGSTIKDVQVKAKETITSPVTPTRKGYDFVEWQLNGKLYDFATIITSDIELKAIWKRNSTEINYVVKFNTDGGNTITDATVAENGKLIKPTNPIKLGYTFKEWQLDGKAYDFGLIVSKDMNLTAIWTAKEELIVKFNSDGGSTVAEMKVYKGDKLGTLPKNPTKTNYVFEGWYNGTMKYTSTTVINASTTLKAKWLTIEEAAVEKAKKAISTSYNITKGGQAINVTTSGCTIANTNASTIATITRGTKDTTKTLEFSITCGEATATMTAKGIIKASTLKYTAVADGDEQNYNVKIFDGTAEKIGYNLYSLVDKSSTGGKTVGSLLASYVASDGYASVNNADIDGYPQLQLKFTNDENTTYVVVKK